MSADDQQLKVSKANLPNDQASYPLLLLNKAINDAYPVRWLVAMSWERDALQTPWIYQIHMFSLHVVGQLFVHPPVLFIHIKDLD